MVSVNIQRQVGEIIWFGIGCFHFGYQKPVPYTFRRRDYIRDLKAALESVPAITDVSIDVPATDMNPEEFEVNEMPTDLDKGEGQFPMFGLCWIRFKIYIPARVQQELAGKFAADDTGTETFVVFLDYAYEGPVSYVVLENPEAGDRDPSTAVRIVRLFLEREIDIEKTPIRFESLGPSPFHADCSISLAAPAALGKGHFAVTHVHRHGYDALQFTSDHAEHSDAFEAIQELFRDLNHELGFFYWINATEVQSMHAWGEIQDDVSSLLNEQEKSGVLQRLTAKIKRSRLLHDVFTGLIGFDVSRTFMLNHREQSYRLTYSSTEGFVRPFVDAEIADAVQYPTNQITTLVGFLERRRSKAVELLIVLMAAVVGGITGATLAHLPTGHLPSFHIPSLHRKAQPTISASPSPTPTSPPRLNATPTPLSRPPATP